MASVKLQVPKWMDAYLRLLTGGRVFLRGDGLRSLRR